MPRSRGRTDARTGHTRSVAAPELLPSSGGSPSEGAPSLGERLSDRLDRLGLRTVVARDAAVAAAWTVVSVVVLLLVFGPFAAVEQIRVTPAQHGVLVALGAAQCILLVLRRLHPAVCLLLVSALQGVFLAVLPPDVAFQVAGPVVAAYTAGAVLAPRPLLRTLLSALVLQVVIVLAAAAAVPRSGAGAGLGDALVTMGSPALAAIAAAAVGAWTSARRDQRHSLRAQASAAVEHQETLTRSAVVAERTRMARELHDIAAHHLSGLIVQAGAAERLVDSDPEQAKQTIRSVRRQGRDTLDDMRSIVGILRETDARTPGTDGDAPVPGLEQLPALFEAARTSGDRITVSVSGPPLTLAPLADVTAYRIAQESLANARGHAPDVPVTVSVTRTPTLLVLEIENPLASGRDGGGATGSSSPGASGTTTGHGLLGMHERADLVGATLTAGPTGAGTWRVRFELPVEASAASPAPSAGDAA
jgi:signal transduction histidine kinase